MQHVKRRTLLKSIAIPLTASYATTGHAAMPHHWPRWHEVDPFEGGGPQLEIHNFGEPPNDVEPLEFRSPRCVIVNLEADALALPRLAFPRLAIEQAHAMFVVSQGNNHIPPEVLEAQKRGTFVAILRNDTASARIGLTDLVRVLTFPNQVAVDLEDFRYVAGRSTSASLPNLVAGSGSTEGFHAGLGALEIALANANLVYAKDAEKLRGVFVIISASKRVLKVRTTKTILNEARVKCGLEHELIYGRAYDETIGDDIRVTVVASM